MADPEHRDEPAALRLVVGLGNPGADYVGSRHNLGFAVVELVAAQLGVAFVSEQLCACELAARGELLLAKPQTYMNRSGHALRCLVERFGLSPADVLVVYDDLSLPLGRLRLRPGGGPAGHRGLESIVESLGTDQVPRLRLGIADQLGPRRGEALVELVLGAFDAAETPTATAMIERAAEAVGVWRAAGMARAMERFNGEPGEPREPGPSAQQSADPTDRDSA